MARGFYEQINLGDGWLPIGLRPPASLEPEEMAGDIARLARMTERAGRRPEDVDIVFSSNIHFDGPSGAARRTLSGHPDQIAGDIQRYKDAGVAHFIFGFEGSTVDQLLEQMERLGKEVLPQVG